MRHERYRDRRVTITFGGCRIRRYSSDGDKEEWLMVFKTAKRQSLSIGSARP